MTDQFLQNKQDGLKYDLEDVLATLDSGERFTTFHTKQEVAWTPSRSYLPTVSPDADYITSYSQVAYTLWVRLMKTLSSIKEASTAWVQPASLPFYDNSSSPYSAWVGNYTDFDISSQLAFDDSVKKLGQSCEVGKPSIEYRQCSERYNQLFFSAAQSFNRYARRRGPVVVQPRTALIWPGLYQYFCIHHQTYNKSFSNTFLLTV